MPTLSRALPLAVAVFLVVPSSFGQSSPVERKAAEALFRSGRDAMKRGDLKTACARFAESHGIDPLAPGPLLNLADCEEQRGLLLNAQDHFTKAASMMSETDERLPVAKERVTALGRRVPHVILQLGRSVPAESKVLDDEQELDPSAIGTSLPRNPGAHVFTVRAPNRADRQIRIALGEASSETVVLEAGEEARSQSPSQAPAGSNARRTAGFVLGAVGLVGIGVGATTGIMALDKAQTFHRHCDADGSCDAEGLAAAASGKALTVASTISFIAGTASTALGIYFLVSSKDTKAPPKTAVFTTAIPGGIQVGWSAGF